MKPPVAEPPAWRTVVVIPSDDGPDADRLGLYQDDQGDWYVATIRNGERVGMFATRFCAGNGGPRSRLNTAIVAMLAASESGVTPMDPHIDHVRSIAKSMRRAAPSAEPAVCRHCGKPAICFGRYEACDGPYELACDECCGHGNEDGHCTMLDPASAAREIARLHARIEALGHTDA